MDPVELKPLSNSSSEDSCTELYQLFDETCGSNQLGDKQKTYNQFTSSDKVRCEAKEPEEWEPVTISPSTEQLPRRNQSVASFQEMRNTLNSSHASLLKTLDRLNEKPGISEDSGEAIASLSNSLENWVPQVRLQLKPSQILSSGGSVVSPLDDSPVKDMSRKPSDDWESVPNVVESVCQLQVGDMPCKRSVEDVEKLLEGCVPIPDVVTTCINKTLPDVVQSARVNNSNEANAASCHSKDNESAEQRKEISPQLYIPPQVKGKQVPFPDDHQISSQNTSRRNKREERFRKVNFGAPDTWFTHKTNSSDVQEKDRLQTGSHPRKVDWAEEVERSLESPDSFEQGVKSLEVSDIMRTMSLPSLIGLFVTDDVREAEERKIPPLKILRDHLYKSRIFPKYYKLNVEGPLHNPRITYLCTVLRFEAQGMGRSNQAAKQAAGKEMLKILLRKQKEGKLPPMVKPFSTKELTRIDYTPEELDEPYDYAGKLQQMCLQRRKQIPIYTEVSVEGPPHRRVFTIQCTALDKTTTGIGPKKKEARRNAAKEIIDSLVATSSTSLVEEGPQ